MEKKEQAIGAILSASCMTDMPAFYPQQLIEAVETRRKKGVPIHTLVLWTKHPASMLKEPLYSYLMDPVDERIDILNPDIYLQETINRLQAINPSLPMIYPLGWWKKEVCLFCDILIYFDEELFTLHEFLLYMISRSKDDGIRELYIGGVFEYVC